MIIETPAFVIDMKKIKKNIGTFQAYGDSRGLKVRPHIKTHKLPEIARLQVEQGAVGITCASVSEAEVMLENGLEDIFIAYSIIGKSKIERLLDLCEKGRIITGVDSKAGAIALSDAATKRGVTVETRLEIDSGMRRAGIPPSEAAEMAAFISKLPNIKLNGIFTYKAARYQGKETVDNLSAAREESAVMAETARQIREAGVNITEISGGSSSTSEFAADETGLTEIRPGAYIFGDMLRVHNDGISVSDIAAVIQVTVISTPVPERAVIDGGSKAFAGDVKPDTAPLFLKGFGHVIGFENLIFTRMSEEHGILETADGGPTGLIVGQQLKVVPNHSCTALNLFDYVYIMNEDGSIRKERVLARGMSF